ncbi:MAG TPA: hypothetical protein VHX38_19010 [Pseudonocardiaceae bacterium]|jgi:hypothetical protein|nr:hypothetical protein [Pseudonocardiaceae bacterium]
MTSSPRTDSDTGRLSTLGPEATLLMQRLDSVFTTWAADVGALAMTTPALLRVTDLARLDVLDNFPNQVVLATPLDLAAWPAARTGDVEAIATEALEPAALALPTAACYSVYLHYQGESIADGTTVTVLGRCFRREQRYVELRRLLAFHMREVVALGSQEFVLEHLSRFDTRITAFCAALGLSVRKEAATDPFYQGESLRKRWQQIDPVKHEFIVDDLAIASVNRHRNFFGERCDITLADTTKPVFTSCAAFGLERWLSVLLGRYGRWDAALAALETVTTPHGKG